MDYCTIHVWVWQGGRHTGIYLSLGKKARSGQKFSQPVTSIIIHWIGPYIQRITTPRDWWENGSDGNGVTASAHFIVKDNEISQAVPLDEIAWHSGDQRNYNSIGIEDCPRYYTPVTSLFDGSGRVENPEGGQ